MQRPKPVVAWIYQRGGQASPDCPAGLQMPRLRLAKAGNDEECPRENQQRSYIGWHGSRLVRAPKGRPYTIGN